MHMPFSISEPGHVGSLRRYVTHLAKDHGFSAEDSGRVALAATELGTNLAKHAVNGGEVLVRALVSEDKAANMSPEAEYGSASRGIELISMDKGPGIPDLGRALKDGYSTMGSPGTGLGALRRLSQEFDIYSTVGRGTVVFCRVWTHNSPAWPEREKPTRKIIQSGVVMIPRKGEDICGDGWSIARKGGSTVIMVADGLGHGLMAFEAIQKAREVFQENHHLSPGEIIRRMHDTLRGTVGAVIAIAAVNPAACRLTYAGVGDISGKILESADSKGLLSQMGIVGSRVISVKELDYPWPKDSMLIMHSDGLKTDWNLTDYPGLESRHPSIIAAALIRDFSRPRDDAVVFVARSGRDATYECS